MDGLHRRDHADAGEPRHVLGIHALGMLDARSPEAPGSMLRRQSVEGATDRAVADRVQADIQLRMRAALEHFDEVGLCETRGAGPIEHLRSAAAERTVEKSLHSPDAQPRIAPTRSDAHALGMVEIS